MNRFAGEKVDLSTYMNSGTDFNRLGKLGQESRSLKKQAGWDTASYLASKEMEGVKNLIEANSAIEAQAAKANNNSANMKSQALTNIFGSVAKGIGKIDFGGGGGNGISFADGMNSELPSYGDYSGIPSGGWGIPFR